jgi:hypothetical protein
MSKRECIRECDFQVIKNDHINCMLYDTPLKVEKYDPTNSTFTVLRCDKGISEELGIQTAKEGTNLFTIGQLENEMRFLEDYFYNHISNIEESLGSIASIIKSLKETYQQKEDKENV